MLPLQSEQSSPDVTVTKTLAPKARRNDLTSYGDEEVYDFGGILADVPQHEAHEDTN
jgi:hypothetical protein